MLPDQRRHLELQIEHYGDGGRGWVLSLLSRRCNIKTKKFATWRSKTHQELNMIYFNCLWDWHLWETSPSCQFKKCPSDWNLISLEGVACVQMPPPCSPPPEKKIKFFSEGGGTSAHRLRGSWQRQEPAFGVFNLQRHSYCILAETSRLCLKKR